MAIAPRQCGKCLLVEVECCCGIDRIDAVLLVDRLAADEAPFSLPLLPEIVEAPGADDVAEHVMHRRALGYCHLGLRDGPLALEIDAGAAEEMQDAHAL